MRAAPVTANHDPVSVAMTRDVICVRREMTVEQLTALLLERNISGAPVVDDAGHPIGVVSKTDLLRERYENADTEAVQSTRVHTWQGYEYELGPGFHSETLGRYTVSDVMIPVVFTLPESAPLSKAAALMAFEGVHRVPIVSPDNKVVGILSALDILRWLARESGYVVPASCNHGPVMNTRSSATSNTAG